MSDENVTMTRKEFVMAQREAFMRGADWRFMASECAPLPTPKSSGVGRYCEYVEAAKETYPLRVTRPRVVADPHDSDLRWRAGKDADKKGTIEVSERGGEFVIIGFGTWYRNNVTAAGYVSAARVKLWADLLANPTELVDQD